MKPRLFLVMVLAMVSAAAVLPISPVRAAPLKDGLTPHKALYEIRMTGTKSGSQVVNISGQMLYEWQKTCDAWVSNHRFNIFYEYADAPAMNVTSDFSTYEPFDGKSIDFSSQRKKDGEVFEELRGHADLASGKAVYTTPPDLSFDLPQGTRFPAMHTLQVIDAIHAKKRFLNAVVFDGGDDEGPVEVNAFIGKGDSIPPALEKRKTVDLALLQPSAHRVRLAFFPVKDERESSDYEMSLLFHENGVISDMDIDYEDFSVSQKLVALEPLQSQCAQ